MQAIDAGSRPNDYSAALSPIYFLVSSQAQPDVCVFVVGPAHKLTCLFACLAVQGRMGGGQPGDRHTIG